MRAGVGPPLHAGDLWLSIDESTYARRDGRAGDISPQCSSGLAVPRQGSESDSLLGHDPELGGARHQDAVMLCGQTLRAKLALLLERVLARDLELVRRHTERETPGCAARSQQPRQQEAPGQCFDWQRK